MKRLITRPRWKRYLRERQRSAQRASVRRQRHAVERHEAHYGMPSSKTETKKHLGPPAQMVAPKRFSMVENPNEAVHFLNRIRAVARARDLFIDLGEVEELTPDAVALLLATINRRELANNTFVSGNHPKDPKLRAILTNSGFRHYVRSHSESAPRMELGKIRRRPTSSETVDDSVKGAVAAELIEFATQKLTGVPVPHQASYRVLGEAMLNTLNHASERPNEYREPWWASKPRSRVIDTSKWPSASCISSWTEVPRHLASLTVVTWCPANSSRMPGSTHSSTRIRIRREAGLWPSQGTVPLARVARAGKIGGTYRGYPPLR